MLCRVARIAAACVSSKARRGWESTPSGISSPSPWTKMISLSIAPAGTFALTTASFERVLNFSTSSDSPVHVPNKPAGPAAVPPGALAVGAGLTPDPCVPFDQLLSATASASFDRVNLNANPTAAIAGHNHLLHPKHRPCLLHSLPRTCATHASTPLGSWCWCVRGVGRTAARGARNLETRLAALAFTRFAAGTSRHQILSASELSGRHTTGSSRFVAKAMARLLFCWG